MLQHLLILLTALVLTAGGLLESAGPARAERLFGAWLSAATAQAELHTLVPEHGTDGIVTATSRCHLEGGAAGGGVCCLSAMGSGCCPPCAVFCEGPMLPEVNSALRPAGVQITSALIGIDPETAKRPPRLLA